MVIQSARNDKDGMLKVEDHLWGEDENFAFASSYLIIFLQPRRQGGVDNLPCQAEAYPLFDNSSPPWLLSCHSFGKQI